MFYENVHVFSGTLRFLDGAMLGLGGVAAWFAGVHAGLWPDEQTTTLNLFVVSLVVVFIFLSQKKELYYARRTERPAGELLALLEVTVYAAGIGCLIIEVFTDGLPGSAYWVTSGVGIVVVLASRLGLRRALCALRRGGRDQRKWLLVGRNRRSAEMAREILSMPQYGVQIAAVIDLPRCGGADLEGRLSPFAEEPLSHLRQIVIDEPGKIRDLIINENIDEVVVYLPYRTYYGDIEQMLEICSDGGVLVKLPSQVFGSAAATVEFSAVGNIPLVTRRSGPPNRALLFVKRVIDIFGAAVGLLAALPLHVVIAFAIKATSPGPVFFAQKRVGLHGRPFTLVKYRTMVADAPQLHASLVDRSDMDGPAFKMKDDPRITPVGRFLRRYHLDELPQLWNVLIGEMSLVGPRPLPVAEANAKQWWQRRRLSMAPGLTCFWQVSKDYRMSFGDWMRRDLEYIDRWSLWMDVRLIFATMVTLLKGNGW